MCCYIGVVRAGSSVEVALQLKTKGAAYFQGECPALCQFGRDGKVTGALQRTSGKVNMTIQMSNNKTMTSFNFVGMVNAAGRFSGTFSGCEISKNAGSVSGVFSGHRVEDPAEAAAAEAAGGEAGEEEGAAAAPAAAGGKKKGKAPKKQEPTSSEEDEE